MVKINLITNYKLHTSSFIFYVCFSRGFGYATLFYHSNLYYERHFAEAETAVVTYISTSWARHIGAGGLNITQYDYIPPRHHTG